MIKHSGIRKTRIAGFTLIELLVVVAIIGLLASIISVSISSQRVKARDSRRVTDIKQVKTGLDLYFAAGSGYPDTTVWNANIGKILQCSGIDILRIPQDPLPSTYSYTYAAASNSTTGCGTTVRARYEIEFYMERQARYYIMDEDGKLRDKVTGNSVTFDSIL